MYNYAKRAVIMHISSKSPQNYKKIPTPPNLSKLATFSEFTENSENSEYSDGTAVRFFQKYFGRLNFFL